LLVGAPGSGKTMLADRLHQTLGVLRLFLVPEMLHAFGVNAHPATAGQ
jgi:predicted kinase